MDHTAPPAYGLWTLVVINSLVFIIFAFSFAKPQNPRDWRSFGAFVLIMFGFLLQWPTIATLAMFPVLCYMYVRLAITEEKSAERDFGEHWRKYAAQTPRFFPRLGTASATAAH